jgi:hypothetical protein
MAFATSTPEKLGKYLGYPASDSSHAAIASALAAIEGMANSTYSAAAIATIEGYLATLDTLAAVILSEAQLEGSTLLSELRREYRRHCALVSVATGLDTYSDTTGATQV